MKEKLKENRFIQAGYPSFCRCLALLAIMTMVVVAGLRDWPGWDALAASDQDSDGCVNCHTDLEEMDDYGAKAASAAAAVAG